MIVKLLETANFQMAKERYHEMQLIFFCFSQVKRLSLSIHAQASGSMLPYKYLFNYTVRFHFIEIFANDAVAHACDTFFLTIFAAEAVPMACQK